MEKTFYNEIYNASEEYFLDHLEELSITCDCDDEIEVMDIDFKLIYAGHRGDGEIDIDILTDVYATGWLSVTTIMRIQKKRIVGFVYLLLGNLMQESKISELSRLMLVKRERTGTFKYPLSDKLVPVICKDDLDKVAEAILNKYDKIPC